MANGLIDIGGGVKVVNPQTFIPKPGDPVRQATGLLQLQNLVEQRETAPLRRKKLKVETKKAEVEAALKVNELLNLDITNALKEAQLESSVQSEKRAKSEFFFNNVNKSLDLFKVDPNLGAASLKQLIPNVQITQDDKKKNAFKASVPTGDGKSAEFLIDPNKITDPKERLNFEQNERRDFRKSLDTFETISSNYQSMLGAAKLATGPADIAIIFNFMKIVDPTSVVREGEQATARNAPGVAPRIRNMYNRALDAKGPIFGAKGSQQRKDFIDAGKVKFQTKLNQALSTGRNTFSRTQAQGLNPKNVLVPIGGLEPEDFMPVSELTDDQLKSRIQRLGGLIGNK